jgi:hypothetical protein
MQTLKAVRDINNYQQWLAAWVSDIPVRAGVEVGSQLLKKTSQVSLAFL